MTKREILKWLESKCNKVLAIASEQYMKERKKLYLKALTDSGLPKIADQIEAHLDAALKLWNDWKEPRKDNETFTFTNGYNSFESKMYPYTASKGDALKCLSNYSVSVYSSEMKQLKLEYDKTTENIKSTYANVIAVAESLPNAKEITLYLKNLGFDLTELMPAKKPATALTVQINPAYLFFGKPAA